MSKKRLEMYLERFGDGIHGTPKYDDKGEFYFINGNNLKDGNIILLQETMRISEEEYEKIKRPLNNHTILLSINGTLGRVAIYRGEKIALGKSVCYLNVKNGINKYFIKYVLSTKEFQKYILQVAHGSTIKNLAPCQVAEYEFNVPENLDIDKIENNNKINSELGKMVKTIYDYWFLQFEFPNEQGRPYKSSGGKMVWNEELKRKIPYMWTCGQVCDLGEIVAGGTPSTKHDDYYTKHGIAWITPYDLSNTNDKYIAHGERDITEKGLRNSSAKLMPKGTVLLTSRAPIGYLGIAANELCTNQGFKSIVPNEKYGSEFIYYTIYSMLPLIKSLGTGSTFTEISKEVVSNIKIVLPNQNVVRAFEKVVQPMAQQREILEKENQELTSLRDFLLPLLMNGQVSFKE